VEVRELPSVAAPKQDVWSLRWFHWLVRVLPLVLAFAAVIFAWQVVVIAFRPHPSVLPPPAHVAETFATLVASGELLVDAGISLARVFLAWTISACIAIPLGLAMGWSRALERVVDPFVELFRPISPLAWIPLAILWFGINEGGKVFIVCIATFFPILLTTIAGVKRIDKVLIHAGQVLGCTTASRLFRKVIFPAAMPSILVGLRISFGMGWAAIIAGELVAARSGLGYLIANGMEILRADKVLIGMAVIGFLGVSFDALFRAIARRLSWGTP
jgi:ABC-type nitrate/sulfonate/bicarbonate transport system permease component